MKPTRVLKVKDRFSGQHGRPLAVPDLGEGPRSSGLVIAAVLALLCAVLPAWLRGATHALGSEARFTRLLPETGLPAADVQRIIQDNRGFIWIATLDGLARFDGLHWRVFRNNPSDPRSLRDSRVLDIAEDSQGDLWIATERGLDQWQRSAERFVHHWPDTGIVAEGEAITVRQVLANPDGTLWLGVLSRGLGRFDPRIRKAEFLSIPPPASNPDEILRTWALSRDRQGRIWIADFGTGLIEYDPATGVFRRFQHDPNDPRSLCHDQAQTIAEDREGFLWIGTGHGLCRLDPERRFFSSFLDNTNAPRIVQEGSIEALIVDRGGRVWIGTDGGGVIQYQPQTGRFEQFIKSETDAFSIVSDVVRSLREDRDGDIWVGHFPAGISHWNALQTNFCFIRRLFGQTNTLAGRSVLSLIEDPNEVLWVGTDGGGLCRFDPSSGLWTSYQHDSKEPGSLSANPVLSLHLDRAGRLWAGTWSGGLNRLLPGEKRFRHYLPETNRTDSLSQPHVWRMTEDHQGGLWIATMGGGINRYIPETDGFEHFRANAADPNSLNHDIVWSLCVASDGTLWAGTHGGLARFQAESRSWKQFRHEPGRLGSLSDNGVVDIVEGRDGILWLATLAGLNRFDPRTEICSAIGESDGLPGSLVMSMLEDDAGRLWVATTKGLCRLDLGTRKIRVFDASDGLPSIQFNRGTRLRRRSGEFLFGGVEGIVGFDPGRLSSSTAPPPVVLTRFDVFNEPQHPDTLGSPLSDSITETRRIEIPSRMSVVSFEFAALGFRAPERTRYQYQLEGFDTDWRPAGPERRATYTNLDPGRYRFRVCAACSEGIWSESGEGLALVVRPAWWQNWWVRGATALGLIAGLLAAGWIMASRRAHARLQQAERERAQALERARAAARLHLALEATNQGFYDLDVQTGEAQASAEYATMLGYDPAQFHETYASFLERLHPDDCQKITSTYQDCLNGKISAYCIELRQRTKSGDWKWITSRGKVVERDARGQPLRILGIHTDITERKKAEAEREKLQVQLTQAHKMESVGRLAGGVAHDFNNMLQAILGNAALALEMLPSNDPSRECLEEIQKSGQRSADLTRQLLAFARKQTISPRVLDLNNTVEGMLKMLKRLIGEDIDLAWMPGTDLWPVKMDPSQVDQILANLCINARDAIASSGKVTIETQNLTLDDTYAATHRDCVPGDYVMLAVSDTGHGMDAITRSHLFEPFFTTKELGKGTGLGLATVFGIVQQNMGLINVYSEPGQGTTFKIYLPRANAESQAPPSKASQRSLGGTETVFLVEDETQILSLGRRILEQHGYTVLTASTPQAALDLASRHSGPIDLLISDVVMPGMNGKELRERLRATHPSLKCLFMSGYTANVIAHHGVLDAGVEFLQKPFTNQTLAEKVRELLARS